MQSRRPVATDDIIDLVPLEAADGALVFGLPGTESADPVPAVPPRRPVVLDGGVLTTGDPAEGSSAVLPREVFSGTDGADGAGADRAVDWRSVERAQDGGQSVRFENGRLVVGPAGQSTEATLPTNVFAAPALEAEQRELAGLARAGLGESVIEHLVHTSEVRGWTGSAGWVLTTRPTSYGDRLVTVIGYRDSTRLYHARFVQFQLRQADGSFGSVDLPQWLGAHPTLSAHGVHIYPSRTGGGVLCLSQQTEGGLPRLGATVLQAAKWADGVGAVLRGRPFPYRQ